MKSILRSICFLFMVLVLAQPVLSYAPKNEEIPIKEEAIAPRSVDQRFVVSRHFKQGFKEHYKGPSFQYDIQDDGITVWEQFISWLSAVVAKLFYIEKESTLQNTIIWIFRILWAAIILVVIYYIIKIALHKEGSWIFKKSRTNNLIYNTVEQDSKTIHFKKEIDKAIALGETRLCIRYYYLWLLNTLADRKIIVWDAEKTNAMYLMEINNPGLKKEFEYLSYLYDYVWYGKFELHEVAFNSVRHAFEKTIKAWSHE